MTYVRQNVWELPGGKWDDTLLWYARAVRAMKQRALNDATSWRFYGAIHGFNAKRWTQVGYLSSGDVLPRPGDVKKYWEQCQHQTWYFFPWHRGYLIAFEANIRATIAALRGPANWALPYWNYFKPNQAALPPAFATADWPDGAGDNPLFVEHRYGPNNDGDVYVVVGDEPGASNLDAMKAPLFVGTSSNDPGFGGVATGFSHDGTTFGLLEADPHGTVHVSIGGANPNPPNVEGLMTDPDSAGLDPIFWLHHANIDRLWAVWQKNPPNGQNPTDDRWLKGPAFSGGRRFVMVMPDGTDYTYAPVDVRDLDSLGYTYDDLTSAVEVAPPEQRLKKLGASALLINKLQEAGGMKGGAFVDLVGATKTGIRLVGSRTQASLQLEPAMHKKITASLSEAAMMLRPDRVYLSLDGVRAKTNAVTFSVYVDLPAGANPAIHPELRAGTVSLFGVRRASETDDIHAGNGLDFTFDITDIIDRLHASNSFSAASLEVSLIPRTPFPVDAPTIERISMYRKGV